jgi:hypothetical protein
MIKRSVIVLVLLCAAQKESTADVISAKADSVSATLYRSDKGQQDLALITERRTIRLEKGANTLHFDGIASSIIPQTAQIIGVASRPRESDFDYNLFDAATILTKTIDKPVELITAPIKSPETRQMGVLKSDRGVLSLEGGNGLEAIGCAGPPARLIVDSPKDLRAKPSLSVVLHSQKTETRTIELAYLAGNIRWSASYVATVGKDQRHLDIEGRIIINNDTETSFQNVPSRFVAGDVFRVSTTAEHRYVVPKVMRDCWGMSRTSDPVYDVRATIPWPNLFAVNTPLLRSGIVPGAAMSSVAAPSGAAMKVTEEKLGDLKLYRLDEPIRIAAHQEKLFHFQAFKNVEADPIQFIDTPNVAFPNGEAILGWRIRNAKSKGMGKPLPKGSLTFYDAQNSYLGTDTIKSDVADNEELVIRSQLRGQVVYSYTLAKSEPYAHRSTHQLDMVNATDHPVSVELILPSVLIARISSGLSGVISKDNFQIWPTSLSPHEKKSVVYVMENP